MYYPFQKASIAAILAIVLASSLFAGEDLLAPVISAKDLNGRQIDSKTLLQKGPVIVWFWNSCCGLNKHQLRALKDLYERYGSRGLEILAINEDDNKKAANTAKAIRSNKIPFTVILDETATIYRLFHAYAVPSVYLISQDGKFRCSHAGFIRGDEKELEKLVSGIFQEKP